MHLALLMTNTDESAFAQRHPKDGEKFAQLIQSVRPTWQVTSYSAKDGAFPADITAYDGVMISGSPASVHDPIHGLRSCLISFEISMRGGFRCLGHALDIRPF